MDCLLRNNIILAPGVFNADELREIKLDLTLENPVFKNMIDMGLNTWKIPKYLHYYEESPNRTLYLPIGYMPTLLKQHPGLEYVDQRNEGVDIGPIEFIGKLRPYQEDAVECMIKRSIGVIHAITGSGKTQIMINYITRRPKMTLVLVDTIELANQFKARLLQFTNLKEDDIGLIGNGSYKVKKVTIALFQSMSKMEDRTFEGLNDVIGNILVDETHICPAVTFEKVISRFSAKYKYGVSATVKRPDGMTPVIFWTVGNIIYSIGESKLMDYVLIPRYEKVDTEYHFPLVSSNEYSTMVSDLSLDQDRNDLIVKTWEEKGKGKQSLILCSRILQIIELQKRIPDSAILISTLTKETKNALKLTYNLNKEELKALTLLTNKKHRVQVMADLQSGKCQTIISTYNLFNKGIDIQTLEVLFLAGPTRSEIWVKQARGRIMRKIEGKQPVIVDFWDKNVEMLKYQARERQRILTEKN